MSGPGVASIKSSRYFPMMRLNPDRAASPQSLPTMGSYSTPTSRLALANNKVCSMDCNCALFRNFFSSETRMLSGRIGLIGDYRILPGCSLAFPYLALSPMNLYTSPRSISIPTFVHWIRYHGLCVFMTLTYWSSFHCLVHAYTLN